jgi:hypothetical protein
VADTRGNGFSGQYGPPSLPAGLIRTFEIAQQCGIPSSTVAVSFNFTVVDTAANGDLRVFAAGSPVPFASTQNWTASTVAIANAAVATLGAGGGISVLVDGVGSINLIIDVNGYYAGGVVTGVIPGVGLTGGGAGDATLSLDTVFTDARYQRRYVRTVVVGPVGTPTANGAALLAASAAITTAGPDNPWLLKIEPGIYDLGSTGLVMQSWIDIEGSGISRTKLTRNGGVNSGDSATVILNDDTELRDLSVEQRGGGLVAVAVFIPPAAHPPLSVPVLVPDPSWARVTRVAASAFGASDITVGIFCDVVSAPVLREVSGSARGGIGSYGVANVGGNMLIHGVTATADTATRENHGFDNTNGGGVIEDLTATAFGGFGTLAYGISVEAGGLDVRHARVIAAGGDTNYGVFGGGSYVDLEVSTGGGFHNYGIYVNGVLSLFRSRVSGSGATTNNYGVYATFFSVPVLDGAQLSAFGGANAYALYLNGAGATILHSALAATQGRQNNYGVYVNNSGGSFGISIDQSIVQGATSSVFATGSEVVLVGGSKLTGGSVNGSGITCAANYNGGYVFFPSTCP